MHNFKGTDNQGSLKSIQLIVKRFHSLFLIKFEEERNYYILTCQTTKLKHLITQRIEIISNY